MADGMLDMSNKYKDIDLYQCIKMLDKSNKPIDFMEDVVPTTVTTSTEKFLSLIYSFILENRDALGYPLGCKQEPYLYCTNDLVGKFTGLIKLCEDKPVKPSPELLRNILQSLMETYADHQGESCCRLYHSVPKEQLEPLLKAFASQQ